MTYWSENRLRRVGLATTLAHLVAIAAGFTAGHCLQEAPRLSTARVSWDAINDVAWQAVVCSAGIAAVWWIYLAIRRRPGAVIYALLWLIWFACLVLGLSVAPAFSGGVPVG